MHAEEIYSRSRFIMDLNFFAMNAEHIVLYLPK